MPHHRRKSLTIEGIPAAAAAAAAATGARGRSLGGPVRACGGPQQAGLNSKHKDEENEVIKPRNATTITVIIINIGAQGIIRPRPSGIIR